MGQDRFAGGAHLRIGRRTQDEESELALDDLRRCLNIGRLQCHIDDAEHLVSRPHLTDEDRVSGKRDRALHGRAVVGGELRLQAVYLHERPEVHQGLACSRRSLSERHGRDS